ncbi:response regulator transcription factor [bacterium]|nr:MAG: response regulator transcription factor [bacterium]
MKQKILLVEDEKNIAESLIFNLESDFVVVWAKTGEEALLKYQSNMYQLIVLDVMLPKLSGYEVCNSIRKKDKETPILFLTAKHEEKDRIEGLKLGADDYLGKPFSLDEFLLRVKALVRRGQKSLADEVVQYSFGSNTINFENYEAVVDNETIRLTKKECMLLKLLIEKEGQVVTREEILTKVWGYDTIPSTRTIDNFIVKLRNYFELNPKEPKYILSIHGVGYKFVSR